MNINYIKSHQLVVCKVDKGNSLVIMKLQEYHSKVTLIIEDMEGVENGGFSFYAHVTEVRKVNHRGSHISTTLPLKKVVLVINPGSPMLYGLPKAHKPGTPVEPVVSYSSSWTVGSNRLSTSLPLYTTCCVFDHH